MDGTVIAYDWTGLTSGTLITRISSNESGAASSAYVWTNVAANGTATTTGSSTTANCVAWTNAQSAKGGDAGYGGSSNTATWTAFQLNLACNSAFVHLYCFQQ